MDEIDALIERLNHEDGHVRAEAALALGEARNPKAIQPLIEALTREVLKPEYYQPWKYDLKRRWIEPLLEKKIGKERADARWNISEALAMIGEPAIPALIDWLKDCDPQPASFAFKALETIGKPALKPLSEALSNENSLLRRHSAKMLGDIKDPDFACFLIKAVKDDDPEVRLEALLALNKIGDPSAIEPLIGLLHDNHEKVRINASLVLSSGFEDMATARALVNSIKTRDPWAREEIAKLISYQLGRQQTEEDILRFEKIIDEGFVGLQEERLKIDKFLEIEIFFASLKIKITKKKNQLSQDKGILLDDKPKPPKRGMYQRLRRATHG
jgi:HEAT repeat protein